MSSHPSNPAPSAASPTTPATPPAPGPSHRTACDHEIAFGTHAAADGDAAGGVALPAGFETFAVRFSDLRTLAEEVVRYGVDAIVLDPPELRERVLVMLTAVAETSDRVATHDDERVSA